MSISKELIHEAKRVSLSDFLLQNHSNDVFQYYDSVLLKKDNNVSVKLGFRGYKKWDNDETGNNIDYLIKFLGYDFKGAVIALTSNYLQEESSKTHNEYNNPVILSRNLVLPEQADNYKNVYGYLISRGIDYEIIKELIDKKLLYQSRVGNNAVFISKNGDFLEIRGTNTYAEERCKHREKCINFIKDDRGWCIKSNDCNDYKKDGFHGVRKLKVDCFWEYSPYGYRENIYVCEASVDAISLYQIHSSKGLSEKSSYVSLGGVANQKTIERLKELGHVVLAVDNDDAGKSCRERNRDLDCIIPQGKDWNDDLRTRENKKNGR